MSRLVTVDTLLSAKQDAVAWSDHGVIVAGKELDALDAAEWQQLEQVCGVRPEQWQARLADAAFGSHKGRVVPLLVKLLRHGTPRVREAAVESLAAKHSWQPDASVRQLLESLKADAPPQAKVLYDELIARIR